MLKLILLLYVKYSLVECAIYDYKVQKLDRGYIERKRQDTRDMCRIFNENNQLLEPQPILPDFQPSNSTTHTGRRRFKRSVGTDQGKLSLREALRVETIVDKMYDDLTEDGNRLTYRKKDLEPKAPTVNPTGQPPANKSSGRRFDFAPAELRGGLQTLNDPVDPKDDVPYRFEPWPKRWPMGIVPYYIDTNTYDNDLLESIRRAFDYFEKATCIRLQKLREKPMDHASLERVEWIYITNPMGIRQCVHSNERKKNKGVQMVVLGYDCMSTGEILHEVMHILGFPHEHTRPDRDLYITVLWDNIKPGYKKYFEIRYDDPLMNLPYDYASVMHYPPRAFSKNGQPTIKPLGGAKIGQRDGLSEIDVAKVSLVYGADCRDRNVKYLTATCPNIVNKNNTDHKNISEWEIKKYFEKRLWPYGIVNYRIRDIMEFTPEERENIKNAVRHIEKETCLVFRDFTEDASNEATDDPRAAPLAAIAPIDPGPEFANEHNLVAVDGNSDVDLQAEDEYRRAQSSRRHAGHLITFVRSAASGCQCPVSGDLQEAIIVTITADCFNSANDLLHVLGHLLGLDHEHNMWDRDMFLTINWHNLPPDMVKDLKDKKPPPASVGYEYDYQSVMHWPWLHVENGVTNIIYPNWNDGWAMGDWQGLSAIDVKKLNHIYKDQCKARQKMAGTT